MFGLSVFLIAWGVILYLATRWYVPTPAAGVTTGFVPWYVARRPAINIWSGRAALAGLALAAFLIFTGRATLDQYLSNVGLGGTNMNPFTISFYLILIGGLLYLATRWYVPTPAAGVTTGFVPWYVARRPAINIWFGRAALAGLALAAFLIFTGRATLDQYVNYAEDGVNTVLNRPVAAATASNSTGSQNTQTGTTNSQPVVGCQLDKIGTWSEVDPAGPQRIGVGAATEVQHFDFYPKKGVKAVSYIVPAGEPADVPAIWMGFGSGWQAPDQGCETYDWVADATNYAEARLDSGHSGLVIDLRSGKPEVVANVANMAQKDIDALLMLHKAAQIDGTVVANNTSGNASGGGAVRVKDADGRKVGDANYAYTVECWQNNGQNLTNTICVVPMGESISTLKGAVWQFSTDADAIADAQSKGKTVLSVKGGALVPFK